MPTPAAISPDFAGPSDTLWTHLAVTWIVGATMDPPLAMLIGDTRISLIASGETHDVLRKVHEISPRILAGFAGDVEAGLLLVEALHAYYRTVHPNWGVDLQNFAEQASDLLRRSYEPMGLAPEHGVTILTAGIFAHPLTRRSYPTCVRFGSPMFEPTIATTGEPVAIGSGRERISPAMLQRLADFSAGLAPGGDDRSRRLAFVSVTRAWIGSNLMREADACVSGGLIQGVVDPWTNQIATVHETFPPIDATEVEFRLRRGGTEALRRGPLLEDFLSTSQQYSAWLAQRGIDSAAGAALA